MKVRITILMVVLLLVALPAFSQKNKNGTTLAASKTVDICKVDDTTWRYSGEVSVWNEGAIDGTNLTILDCIQNKQGKGQFLDQFCSTLISNGTIAAGTTRLTATTYPYSFDSGPLSGDIRNAATVTITNHSGCGTSACGPTPKATYTGTIPPPDCGACGCAYTQGYWGNKPGVVWPAGFSRDDPFFNSGYTWQGILDASAGGNGYLILAKQYIAAALNLASGSCAPDGIFGTQGTFTLATIWFNSASTPAASCLTNSSCGTQKTWGGILDDYNNGLYPDGPSHCGDE